MKLTYHPVLHPEQPDKVCVFNLFAGFLKRQTLHMKEQTDALFHGQEPGILQGCFQFRLAAEDEGESVFRVEAEVDHGFQGQER
jgi:hypothetical protein